MDKVNNEELMKMTKKEIVKEYDDLEKKYFELNERLEQSLKNNNKKSFKSLEMKVKRN